MSCPDNNETSLSKPSLAVTIARNKRYIIFMACLTLFYLIAAFYNLGGFNVPKTSWKPVSAGEYFVVDLGGPKDLSKIYYYGGHGEGSHSVEYRDNSGKFVPLTAFKVSDFYSWKITDAPVRTDHLKVVTTAPGGEVKEIGLFEPESRIPVSGLKIVEESTSPGDSGKPENLFDEQDKIEFSPSFRTSTYFDEIYFARTGYEYMNRLEPYENTHPPLGKILIGLGMAVFGVNPFGWRVMGVLFGAAIIPAIYFFGRKIFGQEYFALFVAFLITFDFMHFAHARIATIDVFAVFFTIMMYYYMYDYYTNKSYEVGFKESMKPLFLSGLFFGLGAAVKWVCVYAGGGTLQMSSRQ